MTALGLALTAPPNPTSGEVLAPEILEAYWGTDPRVSIRENRMGVFRLQLPREPKTEQLFRVVSAAAQFGLVVYDDENGMCFLPDGTVFPESMREVWEFDLAEAKAGTPAPNAPDGRTWLQRIAGELFDALGQGNRRSS
jgi:hypothetical protein